MFWFDSVIVWAALACVVIQLVAWVIQKNTNNADTVDIAWTLGIVICVAIYLGYTSASNMNFLMVLLFPLLWYLRLLMHLVVRYEVQHEDSRYQNLRSHWAKNTQAKFLMFFMFQAGLSVLFSLTAYWVLISPEVVAWQYISGIVLGAVALVGVTIADQQLLSFKRNHDSNQVCDVGLWKYSRHPNYFFEWLHWFVYPILLWQSDYFWWSMMVVGLMLLFLLKLTGIPFSEQQALKKRGAAYQNYMNKTSPFILWRPKSD